MVRIATNEAQSNFAELVLRASRGETILLTESGLPMAKLVPADGIARGPLSYQQALNALREIRSRSKLSEGETIENLIDEGRKY